MFSPFRLLSLAQPGLAHHASKSFYSQTVRDTARCALFVNPVVQELLLGLTKILPERTLPDITARKRPRVITIMTNQELAQAQEKAVERTLKALQMPPVLPERVDEDIILAHDNDIKGFSDCKYVFVDTTLGLHERERSMVVREMDGILRQANCEERDRLSQIYYPRSGRRITPSLLHNSMFREKMLEEKNYKYMLDAACTQFEPDDRRYIEICEDVYKHIEERGTYDILLGTRHYGSMIFTLILHNTIHNFIIHLLEHQRLDDVVRLAQLWHIVTNVPFAKDSVDSPTGRMQIIQNMVEKAIPRSHRHRVDSLLSTNTQSEESETSDSSSSSDSSDDDIPGSSRQSSQSSS